MLAYMKKFMGKYLFSYKSYQHSSCLPGFWIYYYYLSLLYISWLYVCLLYHSWLTTFPPLTDDHILFHMYEKVLCAATVKPKLRAGTADYSSATALESTNLLASHAARERRLKPCVKLSSPEASGTRAWASEKLSHTPQISSVKYSTEKEMRGCECHTNLEITFLQAGVEKWVTGIP